MRGKKERYSLRPLSHIATKRMRYQFMRSFLADADHLERENSPHSTILIDFYRGIRVGVRGRENEKRCKGEMMRGSGEKVGGERSDDIKRERERGRERGGRVTRKIMRKR